jgi:hypothetical protein
MSDNSPTEPATKGFDLTRTRTVVVVVTPGDLLKAKCERTAHDPQCGPQPFERHASKEVANPWGTAKCWRAPTLKS